MLLAANGPWPTLGAKYWFDSRLDPIDDVSEDERRPVGVIYTEDGDLDRIAQSGPLFYKSAVDLTFEISVIATDREEGETEFTPGIAVTDTELEASLDVFEDQIFHALHYGPTGALFRKIVKLPFLTWQSKPLRSSQEGVRLAARTIKSKINVKDICYQAVPAAPPTGLDRLPPALKEVALALDGSTYLAKIAVGVAGAAPVMPARTNLETVGLTADQRTASTPADSESAVVADVSNLQG